MYRIWLDMNFERINMTSGLKSLVFFMTMVSWSDTKWVYHSCQMQLRVSNDNLYAVTIIAWKLDGETDILSFDNQGLSRPRIEPRTLHRQSVHQQTVKHWLFQTKTSWMHLISSISVKRVDIVYTYCREQALAQTLQRLRDRKRRQTSSSCRLLVKDWDPAGGNSRFCSRCCCLIRTLAVLEQFLP